MESALNTCHCNRTLTLYHNSHLDTKVFLNQTLCSQSAFRRGPHQKIVAFTYYGSKKSKDKHIRNLYIDTYFQGIDTIAKTMSEFYPGWVMRLYHHIDVNDPLMKILCKIACTNPVIDICDVKNLPRSNLIQATKIHPSMWRFLPVLDPQVRKCFENDIIN